MSEFSNMKKDLTEVAELVLWSTDSNLGLEAISGKITHLISIHDKALESNIDTSGVKKIEVAISQIHHEIYGVGGISSYLNQLKAKKSFVLDEAERQKKPKVKPTKEEEDMIIKTLEEMHRESKRNCPHSYAPKN